MDLRTKKVAAVLAIGTLMVMLDVTVTVVAIPSLAESFDTNLSTVQWVTTAYALALVAVMPTAAWAIGRFGAKRVYVTALVLFVSGSALAGLAWNIQSLIAFRAVQGLGGGYLQPVGMTIALQMVDERHRGRLMGWLSLPLLIGPVLGPTAGGLLVDNVGWRSLFLINVPIGIAAITLAARLFPRQSGTDRDSLDRVALAALAPGGALLVFGLAQAGDHGDPISAQVLIPAGCGLGLLAIFVVRTLRSQRPLLDLRLLKKRSLAVGAGGLYLVAGAYFGSMLIGPIYIQAVRGDSATTAGLIVIGQAVTTGLVVQIAGRLVDRIDPRRVVWFGLSATVVAMALMTTTLDEDTPYLTLVGIGVIMGIGIGATLVPLMTASLRGISGPAIASGTTILTTGNQFAAAIGAALSATVLTTLFNSRAELLDDTGMAGALRLSPDERITAAPDLASAVADTYLLTLGLLITALVISAFLPKMPHPPQPATPAPAERTPAQIVHEQELSAEPCR
jgi:EmrB/QacA subfamily drug resistance transporter